MKTYQGRRLPGGAVVMVYETNLPPRELSVEPSLAVRNHSPTGFEWGYGGSGPSQLALAILLDYLGDEAEATTLYEEFKWHFVNHWTGLTWQLKSREIDKWIRLKKSNDRTRKETYQPPVEIPENDPKIGQILM